MLPHLKNLFNLVVPSQCVLCGKQLTDGESCICQECDSLLPRTSGGKAWNEAENRMFGRFPFEHGASFCFYRSGERLSALITHAKYRGKTWINHYLAKRFARQLSDCGWPFDIDIVVPVASHFYRRLMRGYNQTESIAEGISEVWGLPVEKHCLRKSKFTASQLSHSGLERREAMKGTFSLRHPEQFAGRHVLVVDDVLTTGATLEACSQPLVEAGARISFLTLGLND